MTGTRIPLLMGIFFLLLSSGWSIGQEGTRPGQGRPPTDGSREAMWPAPSAADWKKPCLITWQRTWEDALAVSLETGKPILVCVNMDGEIASEHYAGIRYRDPGIAKLYEPYVCVIASVYRHTPRDYDEQGRRILCPRFGCVTCGEHIAIESILYEKFFDGQRVAPRHIGVELDSNEMYDVYYAFDTDSVFKAIRDGIENRPFNPPTVVRGDQPIIERVQSRDIQDRVAVESAYQEGDAALRRSLLEAAIAHPEAAQVDLLRLAVFGFDMELARMARSALAQSQSEAAVKPIAEALGVPMDSKERDALINTLARLGGSSPRARMLAVVHQGLVDRSSLIDVEAWRRGLQDAPSNDSAPDRSVLESRIDRQGEVLGSGDARAHIELAEAFLTLAREQPESEQEYARFLFRDAHLTALEAERLGAKDWRVPAVIALAAYYLGEMEEAYERAEAAVSDLPPGETSWNAMAVLQLFAEARWKRIAGAVKEKRDWASWSAAFAGTGQWLTDVHAAYSVLARHPLGTDAHFMAHYDFLKLLSATGQASRVLDGGLARFPDSWGLHARLRGRILQEKGVDALEAAYEAMLREQGASPNLEWFAGYASLVAAEFYRRLGNDTQGWAAYDRAIAHYEKYIAAHPENGDNSNHYIALALAGRARIAYERGDYEGSLAELLASFERKPESAATLDGLNISPVDTARMLLQRLKEQKRDELVAKLDAALAQLDPELLRLPEYERQGPSEPDRDRRPGRRRRPPRRDG